ncbi:MAG: LacI family DNA-binding transcriptional regulator [Acidobacteriaceae bacterium]|jgi:LacI family transcriptional regulator
MRSKNSRPTLSEVAARAGVGTTTVSRVINGGDRVDPRTLARVSKVIRALGYTPNQAARTLKGHRRRAVGFLVPSIADPFFSSCAEAAHATARSNESLLIVMTTQNDLRMEIESVNVLMSHQVDGLIVAPSDSNSVPLRRALSRAAVPVVALDRPLCGSRMPSVVSDNFAGAEMATRHLIEHGYRRIACLTGEINLYTIRERMRGYRITVEAAGLPVILDTSIRDYVSAEAGIRSLLARREPPDAIFTLKNSTTVFTFEALQKLRVPIPESIALLGYDDFELADAVRPSISVIQQPVADLGRIAAELLFHKLGGDHKDRSTIQREQVQLEVRLVPRASCGCSPATR